MENQITAETAPLLNVKLVAEGANGPTNRRAMPSWTKGASTCCPMFSATRACGGELLEWLQNKRSESWDLEEVDTKLYKKMVSGYQSVRDCPKKYDTDWRTAAYIIALSRLEKVYKERGIFP